MAKRVSAAVQQLTVALHHRDAADCPESASVMMGDLHRMGCCAGASCTTTKPTRGGAVRAEYFAKVEREAGVRATYLCAGCAESFARQYGMPFEPVASRRMR